MVLSFGSHSISLVTYGIVSSSGSSSVWLTADAIAHGLRYTTGISVGYCFISVAAYNSMSWFAMPFSLIFLPGPLYGSVHASA